MSPRCKGFARASHRDRKGAAAVEFAMVLPLFVALLLGMIEFGRAMMVTNLVTNAARHGVRQAILDGSTNADVEDAVKDFVRSTTGCERDRIDVVIEVEPAAGNPDPNDNLANATSKDLCRVIVRVNFADVSLLNGTYLKESALKGEATMRHE